MSFKINLEILFNNTALVKEIDLGIKEYFEERAGIREFDGKQTREEAELGAIKEVMPFLDEKGLLHIPSNCPKKYRYWDKEGQDIEATLRELGASEETIKKYTWDKTGGIPKPEVVNE